MTLTRYKQEYSVFVFSVIVTLTQSFPLASFEKKHKRSQEVKTPVSKFVELFFFFQGLMGEAEREVLIQKENEEGLERHGELLSQCSHGNNVFLHCQVCGLCLRKDTGKENQNSYDKSRTEQSQGETHHHHIKLMIMSFFSLRDICKCSSDNF